MRKWAFNILACISLLLCVASAALWGESYVWEWQVARADRVEEFGVLSSQGVLQFWRQAPPPPSVERHDWSFDAGDLTIDWRYRLDQLEKKSDSRFRFVDLIFFESSAGTPQFPPFSALIVPYYVVAMLFAVLPGCKVFLIVRAARRRRRQHCPACGYDLRASGAACPECGAVWRAARDVVRLARQRGAAPVRKRKIAASG